MLLNASLNAQQIAEQTEAYTIEIFLNVYDVTSTPGDPKSTVVRLNKITRDLNLGGVFHGAIQIRAGKPGVDPIEFAFGWCERGTGVYAVHARQNPMYQYRETLSLGLTPKTMAEVKEIVHDLKRTWQGPSYDLLTRNCCHFCEDFAARLEVQPVPGWLNRFAVGAAATVSMTQETVKTMQQIGQELSRLSGQSMNLLKMSWQKAAAAATQQQQQLTERLQAQREAQAAAAVGVVGSSQSAPQLSTLPQQQQQQFGDFVEDYYGQQRRKQQQQQQQQGRDADIVIHGSGGSSRAGTAWLGGLAGSSAGTSSSTGSSSSNKEKGGSNFALAGHSLFAGMQQAGRQLKVTTSKLGLRLSQSVQQQQQQHEGGTASQDSWEAAGAAGESEAIRSTIEQQQQHATPSSLLPATQPKLAPQYCADSIEQIDNPLAALFLDDDDEFQSLGSVNSGSIAARQQQGQQQQQGNASPGAAAPAHNLLD